MPSVASRIGWVSGHQSSLPRFTKLTEPFEHHTDVLLCYDKTMFSAHLAKPNELPSTFELSNVERTLEQRAYLKTFDFSCKFCQGRLIVAAGWHKAWHFRHREKQPCRYIEQKGGQETRQHLALKYAVYTWLKNKYPDASLETDRDLKPINARIPDVVLEYQGEKIAFECQYSKLELSELQQRTRDLQAAGLDVVWIIADRQWSNFQQHIEWLHSQNCEVMQATIEESSELVHEQTI